MECPKWVQVKFAAFVGELVCRPRRRTAGEEHGLCICQEAREGPIHSGCDSQCSGSRRKGAAKG